MGGTTYRELTKRTDKKPIFGVPVAVGQNPTFRSASYYQQQMALVTEHEKPHYQQFEPDCTADKGSYPHLLVIY